MSKRQNFYTPAEVCELLHISRRTLTRWMQAGKIEAVELPSVTGDVHGTRYRFRWSELKRLGIAPESNGKGE